MVTLSTTLGDIEVELFEDDAPLTTQNFLDYIDAGFYDGTIFHRVISGFMIQGGGFTEEMDQKDTQPPIQNEAENGRSNERGTLAMARTGFPHSATSQFFINLVDNTFLDHGPGNFGYAVFGRVTNGMDVVDRIAAVETGDMYDYQDVPVEPVIIETARRTTT